MPRPSAGSRTTPVAEEPRALEHLKASGSAMAELIDTFGGPDAVRARRGPRPGDSYGTLVRAIVGQQLSTKAARTIYTRLEERFGGRTPTPRELLETDPADLRAVGLSGAKAAYLRDLAEHVEDGELDLERLAQLPDEQVIEQLTAVKGLGTWTAHMFMIFHLGRPDVLPVGDLGIRKAAQALTGGDALPTPSELEVLAEPWRPYRSLASLYLWRSLDNEPG
ncbi:MAG: DNA-3-methyladenine glycosylase 2 family protein [Thermoleophilaceae bacterium]|nr:DNA-3-methyladenine glycosylase 2 family protein [Thermoleophilaceae bacterium]